MNDGGPREEPYFLTGPGRDCPDLVSKCLVEGIQ